MVRLINRSVPLGVSWRPSEDRNRAELRAAVRQLKSYFSDIVSLTLAWYIFNIFGLNLLNDQNPYFDVGKKKIHCLLIDEKLIYNLISIPIILVLLFSVKQNFKRCIPSNLLFDENCKCLKIQF